MDVIKILKIIKYKTLEKYDIIRRRFKYVSKTDIQKLKSIESGFPSVLSTTETLEKIIEGNLSLCRFGDAEFDICQDVDKTDKWQKSSKELSGRLEYILKSNEKGVLICIPPFDSKYNNIQHWYGKFNFWQDYWFRRYESLSSLFVHRIYGNSFVSRDSVFYENDVSRIKRIWDKKKVVFVFGKGGRFKYIPDLFDNIIEKNEIEVPPTNAFDKYEKILSECIEYDKQWMFLISAGPTATVLAYDLFKLGYRALDIGHLPNCYEQYLGKIKSPESIPRVR